MARQFLLVAFCLLPAIVSAVRQASDPYTVEGRVYCDTCQCGFETTATTYIAGAKVRVECKDRHTTELLHSAEGTTDKSGAFKIYIKEDQGERLCDAVLVSSPQKNCKSADPGRDRSRIVLTSNNGMMSKRRFANALGFVRDQPLAHCAQVLQQYHINDDQF
ncbi:hypothetical protein Ancab_038474 [Ancistrocladus abbreviatus]